MANRPKPPRRPLLDDVLAGREIPPLEALLALIQDVNPTGLGLPEAQERRRYRQKSQLQGLLIGKYGDRITAEPDPDHAGVVRLEARSIDRDGCHAFIDELDEAARAWVRRQLDLAEDSDCRVVMGTGLS